MKIALAQMVSGDSLEKNLDTIFRFIRKANQQAARWIIFPENCLLMKSSKLNELAETLHTSNFIFDKIASYAKRYEIAVLLGSVPMKSTSERVYAASLLWNALGEQIARYDKIHLFDASVDDSQGNYQESSYIKPGTKTLVTCLDEFLLGFSICYDLRFPQLFQKLRQVGAQVIAVPSAFTNITGEAHWEPLLRARAIENQCYILGVNQGGEHSPSRVTYGHTMAIDPWGRIIGRLDKGENLLCVDINLAVVASVREKMPVFEHQRTLM